MNDAQKALLAGLRELVDETPRSGAVNAGGKRLYITRFARAVEARAEDGPALVEYVRSKVHESATESYNALVKAKRPDLTVEALVGDVDAPWASEFTDRDREAARARLGAQLEAHRADREKAKAEAIEHHRTSVLTKRNQLRNANRKPPLTPEEEQAALDEVAARWEAEH